MAPQNPLPPGSDEDNWSARAAALPQLVTLLPPDQRYVIVEHFYEGRSVAELAHGLECPPEQVELLLATALRTLRQILCG